jgi:hypothetical protein
MVWIGLMWLIVIEPIVGSCERVNESLCSVRVGEFLDCMRVVLASWKGLSRIELIDTKVALRSNSVIKDRTESVLNYSREIINCLLKLVFWVVIFCAFVGMYKRFVGIYCLHLQG